MTRRHSSTTTIPSPPSVHTTSSPTGTARARRLADGELVELAVRPPLRAPAKPGRLVRPPRTARADRPKARALRLVVCPEPRPTTHRVARRLVQHVRTRGRLAAERAASSPRPARSLQKGLAAGDLDDIDRRHTSSPRRRPASWLIASETWSSLASRRPGTARSSCTSCLGCSRRTPRPPRSRAGLMREIGRHRLGGHVDRSPRSGTRGTRDLALVCSHAGSRRPGSNFIYPTMSLVERSGLASEVLAAPTMGLSVKDTRRELLGSRPGRCSRTIPATPRTDGRTR